MKSDPTVCPKCGRMKRLDAEFCDCCTFGCHECNEKECMLRERW